MNCKPTTIEELKIALRVAADVMRRLPPVKVQGYKSTMPEVIHDFADYVTMDIKEKIIRPLGEEIDYMDKVLSWLDILDAFETKLVWKRACKIPWKVLSYEFGKHRSKLSEKHNIALEKVLVAIFCKY